MHPRSHLVCTGRSTGSSGLFPNVSVNGFCIYAPLVLLFFTLVYCPCIVLLFFTVFYCFAIILLFFTVCVKTFLFLLPHADIHHINRIHKKHDNTFCAVDFSGCPCKSPYNHTHDDQDDNINDILHEECDRADRSCNTKDQ